MSILESVSQGTVTFLRQVRWLLHAVWVVFWVFAISVAVVRVRQHSTTRLVSSSSSRTPATPARHTAAPALKTVTVEEVTPRSLEGRVTFTGTLEPAAVETAIPQVNGRVVKVLVQPDSVVKGGDIVVQLDRSSLQADVKYTKTFLFKAQARQAAVEKERAQALSALEQATEQLEAAQQEIAAAQAGIAQAEASVQKLRQQPPPPPAPAPSPPPSPPPTQALTSEELAAAQAAVRAAELDVAQARAAVEQSEAALTRSQEELAAAGKEFQRAQKLYDIGAVARRFFESKQEAHAAAQKQVRQVQEQLQERRARWRQADAALAQMQQRLAQAKAQPPAPPATPPAPAPAPSPPPPRPDVAEVVAAVKRAREIAEKATAHAKEARAAYEAAQQRAEEVEQRWQTVNQQVKDAQEMLSNRAVLVGAADLHAPCDGVVTQVAARAGDKVTAGTPLVFVAPLDTVRVRLPLPQDVLPFVRPKMNAQVSVPLRDGQGKEFIGTVEHVLSSDTSEVATPVAEILVPTQGAPVKMGAPATCALVLGQHENVLTVPVEAIRSQEGGHTATVFVAVATGSTPAKGAPIKGAVPHRKVEAREVTLGWTDGRRYEVREGLASGEQVVIEGPATLREGELVHVKR